MLDFFLKGNKKKISEFLKVNRVIYSSLPISLSSFMAIALTVVEKSCLQGYNAEIFKGT